MTTSITSSQTTLEELFYIVPIYLNDSLDQNCRKKLIENYKINNDEGIYKFSNSTKIYKSQEEILNIKPQKVSPSVIKINTFLPHSGYLSFYEQSLQSENGFSFEMTFWNMKNNKKLIITKENNRECCGPRDEFLIFHEYQNGQIKEIIDSLVIPKLTVSDVINTKQAEQEGLNTNEIKDFFLKPLESYYKLPEKGKDIIFPIKFFEEYLESESEIAIFNKFKKYYYKEIIFVWDNEKFIVEKN